MVRFGNGKFNQIFILLKDVLRKDVIHVFEAFLDRLLEAFLKLGEVGEEIAASKSASQALKERNAIVI